MMAQPSPIRLKEIERIAELIEPLCDGDEQLFSDMMEGESPVHDVIQRLHDHIASDGEMIAGIKARADDLAERRKRLEARVDNGKQAIGMVLRAAKLSKCELPEATYSVRDGKAKLVIIDPEAVPYEFTRVKEEPDKPAINAAFENKDELPNWLVREPARDVVTQRSK